jgi:hypothetical protein
MDARGFCDLAGEEMRRFRLLKDLGNMAVHRTDPIRVGDAVTAARELFQVLRWFALTYGRVQQRVRGLRALVEMTASRSPWSRPSAAAAIHAMVSARPSSRPTAWSSATASGP